MLQHTALHTHLTADLDACLPVVQVLRKDTDSSASPDARARENRLQAATWPKLPLKAWAVGSLAPAVHAGAAEGHQQRIPATYMSTKVSQQSMKHTDCGVTPEPNYK